MVSDHTDPSAELPEGRWSVLALTAVMYPFCLGAGAVNLFFISLMGQVLGFRALSTPEAIIGGVIIGVPMAWIAGRWLRGMMDEAYAANPER